MAATLGKKATWKKSAGTAYSIITELNFGGISWEMEDVTGQDANVYTSRLPTVRTHNPVTVTLIYDQTVADHASLYAAALAGTLQTYVFTYPNGSNTETGECAISDWKWDTKTKNLLKAMITFTPTGAFTFA
jgi:hypothetical protein